MQRSLLVAILALTGILPGAAARAADAVGQVMGLKGSVQVKAPGGKAEPATLMMLLFDGTQVTTGKGAKVTVLFYRDRHREDLLAGSAAKVTAADFRVSKGKRAVGPKMGPAAAQRMAGGKLASASPGRAGVIGLRPLFQVTMRLPMYPAIRVLRPEIAWDAYEGADHYSVKLLGSDRTTVVGDAVDVKDTKTAFPAKWPALEPGRQYVVQVAPYAGDKAAGGPGRATVNVIDKEAGQAVAREEKPLLARLRKDPADVATRVELAQLYEEYELLGDAIPQFEEVVRLLPQSAETHYMLSKLYNGAKLSDKADEELKKGDDLAKKP